jgi:hypothetical protein
MITFAYRYLSKIQNYVYEYQTRPPFFQYNRPL